MKKNYTTPTVVANGEFVTHTRTMIIYFRNEDGAPFRKDPSFGATGFGL